MERDGEIGLRHIVSVGIVAVLLHGAVAMAVFWAPPQSGAIGAGRGGLDIALGAAGGAPGLAAPVTPEATETQTTETKPTVTPEMTETLDTETEAAASPDRAETFSAEPETSLEVPDVRPVEPTVAADAPQATQRARDAMPDTPLETPPDAAVLPRVPKTVRPETARPAAVPVALQSSLARSVLADPQPAAPVPTTPERAVAIAEAVPAQAEATPTPLADRVVPAPVETVTAKPLLPETGLSAPPTPLAPQAVDLARADPVTPAANPESEPAAKASPPVVAAEISDPERRPVPMPKARPKGIPPAPKRRTARKPAPIQPKPARPTPAPQKQKPEPVREAARPTGDAADAPSDTSGQGKAGASGNAAATGQSNQARAGGNPGAKRDYMSRLAAILSRHKRYPSRAQSRRQEGTGRLYFVVEQNGRVSAMRLQKSSGHRLLDDEILAILGRVGTFPPIPEDVGVARLEVVVPINFNLR
ncbi:MAG: TonB family protein [Pseudomonadota bacterium]